MPERRDLRNALLPATFAVVVAVVVAIGLGAPWWLGRDARVLRITQSGGGRSHGVFELEVFASGRLIVTQQGAGDARPRTTVFEGDAERQERVRALLANGGFLTAPRETLRSSGAEPFAGEWEDVPSWTAEVLRRGDSVVTLTIPPAISERLHPELAAVPQVQAVWGLVRESRDHPGLEPDGQSSGSPQAGSVAP